MDLQIDEKGKFFTPRISKDAVSAFVLTSEHLIVGSIYARPGTRLTDEMNSDTSPFLPITDAAVYRRGDEVLLYNTDFLLVAYHRVHVLIEYDTLAEIRPALWQQGRADLEPQPHISDDILRVNERGKFFSVRVPKDAMPTMIRTAAHTIVGYFHMRPDRRLRDELNEARTRFLPVTDARIYDADTLAYHAGFALVAAGQIELIAPYETINPAMAQCWASALDIEAHQ